MVDLNKDAQNPLDELSDLRLELSEEENFLDLVCLLRFGTGEYTHKGQTFEVGFLRAQLQLSLEGVETVLGSDFAEATIPSVEEVATVRSGKSATAGANAEFNSDGTLRTGFGLSAEVGQEVEREATWKTKRLPISTRPGNRWQIEMPTGDTALSGSAMRGERLTRLSRKAGVNRVGIIAEVQIKKREICVTPPKANSLTKALRLVKSRNEVVALVLQKAMRREAAEVAQHQPETVVVSKITFSEPE